MLTKILHALAAPPWMYEIIQTLAGREQIRNHLRLQVGELQSTQHVVLDLAGGTGLWRNLWPNECEYICLDLDLVKLGGLHERRHEAAALCADASHIPLRSESVDVLMCINMSHHLCFYDFERVLRECVRVLRVGGAFIFMDAVTNAESVISRLLWRYDRGRFPHTEETVSALISKYYPVVEHKKFSIYHQYVVYRCLKSSSEVL